MNRELDQLQAFTRQLAQTGMSAADIAARGYDYALLLFQAEEEKRLPRGEDLPTLLKIHIMDHAADLLKHVAEQSVREAVERGGITWRDLDDSQTLR